VPEGALVQLPLPPYHVLVTRVDGVPLAMEDACPHSGRSLCGGALRRHVVVCPGHAWEIDVRTGEVLTAAGRGERAPRFVVRTADDGSLVVYRPR
jgi:nitrite reductase/ring-hydroxylating ferredoxin subunit